MKTEYRNPKNIIIINMMHIKDFMECVNLLGQLFTLNT